jgi:hypothetical protein
VLHPDLSGKIVKTRFLVAMRNRVFFSVLDPQLPEKIVKTRFLVAGISIGGKETGFL